MVSGTSPPGGLSFDDALTKYVGEFGRTQIRIMVLASLFWVGNALLILLMVFHASPSPLKEHWWQCNDPNDERCAEVFALTDPSRDVCDLPRSSWSWTHPSKSIISNFNLICGSAWRSQFANSGFFMGYLVGSGVFGSLADSRGRKVVLFGSTALGALFTMAAGLAPNYALYFIFRLITGIGAAGQALTAYIMATESVGPSWRGFAGVATQLFFILGEFVLVPVAYVARPWRALCFACAVINAALLALWPTIPESPRWLLVRGRREEATAILARIAEGNHRAMPSEPLADAGGGRGDGADDAAAAASEEGAPLAPSSSHLGEGAGKAPQQRAGSPAKPVTLMGMLLRDRHMLRRFLVLAYVWMVMCMAYYGISLALGGLPGSIYITFIITAAAELPSNLLAAWMIERYGRHNTMAAGMLLGGAACVGCAFAPAGVASALLAAVGKFGCAGAFTVASIFTSELFPTLVRSAVLGAENEAARVGGISAPFIVLVGISTGNSAMPFIIFGVTALVAGVAIFTLPETLGTTLPDTMADMSGIQSIFTTQPWRRGGWRQTLREMFRARGGPATHGSTAAAASSPIKDPAAATGPCGVGRSATTALSAHAETTPCGPGGGAGSTSGGELGLCQYEISLGDDGAAAQGAVGGAAGNGHHATHLHYQHHHTGHHHSHTHRHAGGNGSGLGNGRDVIDGGADGDGHGYGTDERHLLLHAATARSDTLTGQRTGLLGSLEQGLSGQGLHRGATDSIVDQGAFRPREAAPQDRSDGPQPYNEHKREELRRYP